MRNILTSTLLFIALVTSFHGWSQTGWKWGVGQHVYGPNFGFEVEGFQAAADRFGNSFAVSIGEATDSALTGSIMTHNPNRNNQLMITKADTAGHVLWVLSTPDGFSYGNDGYYIVPDSVGDLYLYSSYSSSSLTLGTTTLANPIMGQTCFLAKISPAGNVIWARNIYSGTAGSLGIDGSNNVYICGGMRGVIDLVGGSITLNNNDVSGATTDIIIAKFDHDGNVIWAENYGGTGYDFGLHIAVVPDGHFYISGTYNSTTITMGSTTLIDSSPLAQCYYAAFDSSGASLWAYNAQAHVGINAIATDASKNMYSAGYVDSNISFAGAPLPYYGGLQDIFVAKYNASGIPVWGHSAGGNQPDRAYDIVLDACGNLFIDGSIGSPVPGYTITIGGTTVSTPDSCIDPMIITRYDTNGNYYSSLTLPSGGDDFAGIAVDNHGNLFTAGDYVGGNMIIAGDTLYNNPVVEDTVIHSTSTPEAQFMAKYTYAIGGCYPNEVNSVAAAQPEITIYPNPASDEITIHSSTTLLTHSAIELLDMTGRLIRSCPLTGNDTTLSVADIAAGVYICRISQNGIGSVTRKIDVIK